MNKFNYTIEKLFTQYEIERIDKRKELKEIDDNIFSIKQMLLKTKCQKLFLRPFMIKSSLSMTDRMILLINHVEEIKLENGTVMYHPSGIRIIGTLPAKKSIDSFIIKSIEFNYQFYIYFIPDDRIIIGKTAKFIPAEVFKKMLKRNVAKSLLPEEITAVNNKKLPKIPNRKIVSVKIHGKYTTAGQKNKTHAKNL